MTSANLLTVELRYEQDVVATRQRARQIAGLLGLTAQEQTSFATAVSEIARNAFRYGGGGKVEYAFEQSTGRPMLIVRVRDQGPGIPHIKQILDGQYRSQTGMGLGIIGAKRLSDFFDVAPNTGGGTVITLGKRLPQKAVLTSDNLAKFSAELAQRAPQSPIEEVQQQNRELMVAMESLQERQSDIERLNTELSETNRGVLALYAELDNKASAMRNASELKSRFLSDMSHELRTPLNAMISISGLLLDRTDGELTCEQEKQVQFILKSADSLRDMVSDLLDLAKIEAGRTDVRVAKVEVAELFIALRGMFRPFFAVDGPIALVVEEEDHLPALYSDEQKVSQILRNFVSNSLKFTKKGEVRIGCRAIADDTVTLFVSDTGIGIPPRDVQRIFEDYAQVDSDVQRSVRGTGLGLPLSRKLARLLGGEVTVSSETNVGSTFYLTLPIRCPAITADSQALDGAVAPGHSGSVSHV